MSGTESKWPGCMPRRVTALCGMLFTLAGCLWLTGCGQTSLPIPVQTSVVHHGSFRGNLHGGQQPVTSSAIQLYAMGNSGDASAAVPLLSAPALTDGNGDFNITDYSCPSATSQLYLVSIAGNPGLAAGSNNPNLAEMALLGPCSGVNDSTTVVINEVTTVAAVYALASFMTTYDHIGASSTDQAQLLAAIQVAESLANFNNGVAPGPALPEGETAPTTKLLTLANILAACVNSLGGAAGDGSVCGNLFSYTARAGLPVPTDTILATLRIAESPTQNVAQIYSLSGWAAPFQPALAIAPPDWSLFLNSTVPTPVFAPGSGSYDFGQTVTLSEADPNAKIFYTTDGSVPTAASTPYTGPIVLTKNTVLQAVAILASLVSLPAQASMRIAAAHLVFTTQPGSTTPGAALAPTPVVAVENSAGTVLTTVSGPVSLSLGNNPGGAQLSGTLTVNAVKGVASFPGVTLSAAGNGYTLNATASGVTAATSKAFAIAPLAASGTTYYLSPEGNDSNSGLSPDAAWLSPLHSINCGDTILATPSTNYSYAHFGQGQWGKVNCTSGNNVAWLQCATFDGCKISVPAWVQSFGISVSESYWGVQGWEVNSPGLLPNGLSCFNAGPVNNNASIHHIVFANNIASTCPLAGFGMGPVYGGTASVDYYVAVGNIAYNAGTSNLGCGSGIDVFAPAATDSAAGTHIYVAGNFIWSTTNPYSCWDGNGIIFDTFDGGSIGAPTPYVQQAVIDNNMSLSNAGVGARVEYNNAGNGSTHAPIFLRHNTLWNNSLDTYQNGSNTCGEIQLFKTQNTTVTGNLARTNSFGCYGSDWNQMPAIQVNTSDGSNVVNDNVVWSNYGFFSQLINTQGFSFGSLLETDPQLAGPATPGVPDCSTAANVPSCAAPIVANFKANNSAVAAYGYQIPNTQPVQDALFPKWLCNVNLPAGLVSMGCL